MQFLEEWNEKGARFAREINDMIAFAAEHGWDKWEKKDITDERAHLADEVLTALRQANKDNTVKAFRESCPPSYAPFAKFVSEQGQVIADLHFIDEQTVVFLTGAHYEARKGYKWNGNTLEELDPAIVSIGKSPLGNCFATAANNKIITSYGWQGTELYEFDYPAEGLTITQLIPYNDGSQVIVVSSKGIYRLGENEGYLLHPIYLDEEAEDEEYAGADIDMEHAALSPNNNIISLGSQDSSHIIISLQPEQLEEITPYSEYPHFTLFSKDGKQVLMNACHFYNGTTIAVPTDQLDAEPLVLNEEDRIYAGVATSEGYIWGGAYGYIKAFDYAGNYLWQYYVGSTISGMAVSADEKTLYVGCYSGMLHQLKLGAGMRDAHTIGTGNHYEESRLICWKNEPAPLKW